ncbi:MAG TPA: phosphoribosyltransferase family protein [Gemmata sp.]
MRLKFVAGEGLGDLLGRTFAEERAALLRGAGADLVVPVPLHWWRKWMRGYNQSAALAREIAASLGRPFEPHLLRRVRYATQQAQPTRAARLVSMKDVFRVRPGARLGGKTVLLVDDVMTTGSTVSAVARALLSAGAGRVVVAVLARR